MAGYPSWKISVGVSSPFPERVLAGLSAENAAFFPSRRQVSFFNPKKKKKAQRKSTKSAVKRKGELAAKSGSLWLLPPAESLREPPARGRRGEDGRVVPRLWRRGANPALPSLFCSVLACWGLEPMADNVNN